MKITFIYLGGKIIFNKKIIILAMFLVILLAATAVSAAENATEDIAIADDGICEELDISTDEILTSNPTIADLNTKINNNTYSEITLDSDYAYTASDSDFVDGIVINRDLTIDGNGHTIDGGNKIRIFHVIGGSVTFKNLTFINGYAGYERYSGAIWAESTVAAINCTFINNTAHDGGAVANVNAVNCIFYNNTATEEGGAASGGSAENCTFYKNTAKYGGAIVTKFSYEVINNCIFVENVARQLGGGAIYVYNEPSYRTISNCIFIRNRGYGTVIFESGRENKVEDCIFINDPTDFSCTTIYWKNSYTPSVCRCVFICNPSTAFNSYYEITADDNWFGNNATDYNVKPNVGYNTKMTSWLFLNATANPNPVVINDMSDITFDLYRYDSASGEISKYDIGELKPIMRINSTNGNIDKNIAETGEVIKYTATSLGTGSITAKFANFTNTLEINVRKSSFNDLQDIISNAEEGSTITLKTNYTFIDTDSALINGIVVNSDLTIDGNGFTIDGSNKARIFHVINCNVIFKNITFINGYTDIWGFGGAIWTEYSDAKAINCTFNNNHAYYGGAVHDVNAVNCTFHSNTATKEGGATYGGTAVDCTFDSNTAEKGGAVYTKDNNTVITNCIFVKNFATDIGGGAIYLDNVTNRIISNCVFANNIAHMALSPYSGKGGAIYFNLGENNNVSNCILVNNTADTYGANIYWNHGEYSAVYNSVLISDSNTSLYSDKEVTADNNWFGNNATDYNIKPNFNDKIKMTSWLFLNATSNLNPIAITHTANITFDLYRYDSASGEISKYDIGELKPIMAINSTNGNIDKNIAETGEIIEYTATSIGTGIITAKFANITNTLEITVCKASFKDLQDLISNAREGSTIKLHTNYTYTDDDSALNNGIIIDRDLTIDGNGFTIDGSNKARIFHVTNHNVIFKNITFINGYTNLYGYGGAIWTEYSDSKAINCTFNNNNAYYGGAITDVNAVNCTFNSNTATNEGGAVYEGSAVNCTFNSNHATYGGAIYEGSAVNCTFNSNTATNEGGAVYGGSAVNCTFNSNHAAYGGAVYGGSAVNCTFNSNHANFSGGAIYQNRVNSEIHNCDFVNNSADEYGGAVYQNRDNCKIYNCTFVNNNATIYGGAIDWNGDNGEIYNCIFVNNTVEETGSAIDMYGKRNGVVSNCIFVNNAAKDGGIIYWYDFNNGVISNCIFINNNAANGTINCEYSNNLTITHNIFLNNNGSDINFRENDTISNISYNWFGNTADNYKNAPNTQNVTVDTWLFLNATANPSTIMILNSATIVFKLYAYNSTSGIITEYDYTLLNPVILKITANNGDINATKADLGETIKFTAKSTDASVTATIENVAYTIKLNVTKRDSNLSVESKEVTYSENTIITLDYNSIATGKVNITLNGKKYNLTFTDLDLNTQISLGSILPDEYDIIVAYSGDEYFFNATATATLKVDKITTQITSPAVTATYNSAKYLTITLKDSTGKAVSGAKVTVNLNGIKTYATDKNGQIKINVATMVPKTYSAKITFAGDDIYTESAAAAKVIVKKAKAKIVAKKKTFKKAKKVKKYTITLKSGKKPIKKVKVTLKIKKKTYKAKTNAKGKATFKIKKLTKKGKYTATIKFKGNKYYNKATKKVKIKIK